MINIYSLKSLNIAFSIYKIYYEEIFQMKPWSQEKSLQLIELYKQRPVLWDKRDKDYKNNETKADAWAEICSIIGMRDAEKKMNILNVQYRRELKRALINQSVTYDYKNVRKWFALMLCLS